MATKRDGSSLSQFEKRQRLSKPTVVFRMERFGSIRKCSRKDKSLHDSFFIRHHSGEERRQIGAGRFAPLRNSQKLAEACRELREKICRFQLAARRIGGAWLGMGSMPAYAGKTAAGVAVRSGTVNSPIAAPLTVSTLPDRQMGNGPAKWRPWRFSREISLGDLPRRFPMEISW